VGSSVILVATMDRGMSRAEFNALYDACAQDLLVFFTRRTTDPHTARDLWAETIAAAFAGRRRFRGSGSNQATSWLYGIAYRQLAQFHRRGAIERRALRRLATVPPPLSDADVERLEELAGLAGLRDEVDQAMDRLPPALREAVTLRVVEELPYSEVASRLGITQGAARVRVSRALHALRTAVPAEGRAEGT
jgi:RNA polymerase sigma factor (sigma-70 family)